MPTTQTSISKPLSAPNFQITPRLLALNADIVRLPLIRRDQLRPRHPNIGERSFYQLLHNLISNGFAYCPKAQNKHRRSVAGSLPAAITPTILGVRLHRAFFSDPVPDPTHDDATDPRTWNYMRHEANTSTASLDYQASAATVPHLQFFDQPQMWGLFAPNTRLNTPVFDMENCARYMAHDFIADHQSFNLKQGKYKPLRLSSKLDWPMINPSDDELRTEEHTFSTHPDGYFGQAYKTQQNFFFESDEGSETIVPGHDKRHSAAFFNGTSLLHKCLAYTAAYQNFHHTRRFGITSFKVIFETTTSQRARSMQEHLASILLKLPEPIHDNFILITDRVALAACDNNRYHPRHYYKNLRGKDVHLLDF